MFCPNTKAWLNCWTPICHSQHCTLLGRSQTYHLFQCCICSVLQFCSLLHNDNRSLESEILGTLGILYPCYQILVTCISQSIREKQKEKKINRHTWKTMCLNISINIQVAELCSWLTWFLNMISFGTRRELEYRTGRKWAESFSVQESYDCKTAD